MKIKNFDRKLCELKRDGPYDLLYYGGKLIYRWKGEFFGYPKDRNGRIIDEHKGKNSLTVYGQYRLLGMGLDDFFSGIFGFTFGLINGLPENITTTRRDGSNVSTRSWTENDEYGVDLGGSSPHRRLLEGPWGWVYEPVASGPVTLLGGRQTTSGREARFSRADVDIPSVIGGIFYSTQRPFPNNFTDDILSVGKFVNGINVYKNTVAFFKYRVQIFNECHDPGAILEPEAESPTTMC